MKKIISIFIVSLLLFACSTSYKKIIEETYPDGAPKIVKYYTDNTSKELIKEVQYYQNRNLKLEGKYKNGQRDGKWTYWYENGNKWSEGNYNNGIDDGMKTVWYGNGQKYYEGNYSNGKRVGKWRFWDEAGKLVKEVEY
ncbi:MAG: hypothetical protein K8R58_02835 [Bacteroidales bacterium]|nr:hypothetical protein [Bacteroidales bacterium]